MNTPNQPNPSRHPLPRPPSHVTAQVRLEEGGGAEDMEDTEDMGGMAMGGMAMAGPGGREGPGDGTTDQADHVSTRVRFFGDRCW